MQIVQKELISSVILIQEIRQKKRGAYGNKRYY